MEVLERKKKNLRRIVDENLIVEAKRLGMKLSCKAPLLGSGNPSMRDKLLIVSPVLLLSLLILLKCVR